MVALALALQTYTPFQSRSYHFLILLLCYYWMHMGNGVLGLLSGGQFPDYEDWWNNSWHCNKLARRLRLHPPLPTSTVLYPNTFQFFACFNLIFLPVVYFFYPKTSDRTLEDLDYYFDIDSPPHTLVPNTEKTAKQRARPVKLIEAEAQRVETGKELVGSKAFSSHVEYAGNDVKLPGTVEERRTFSDAT
ncbi:MAG: hypothetical protein M1827_005116 [Pycnora praestabilis]|nr:MAG: hypothetical protein M1827_005116 [Pycnora praestabilis]